MPITREAIQANQGVVDRLAQIGKQKGAPLAQIVLAWLLAQKPWIVPIPGSRKLHRLDEPISAAAVELTPVDLPQIDGAMATITVLGDRYLSRSSKRGWLAEQHRVLLILRPARNDPQPSHGQEVYTIPGRAVFQNPALASNNQEEAYGHQAQRLAAVRQRTSRVVYRLSAD